MINCSNYDIYLSELRSFTGSPREPHEAKIIKLLKEIYKEGLIESEAFNFTKIDPEFSTHIYLVLKSYLSAKTTDDKLEIILDRLFAENRDEGFASEMNFIKFAANLYRETFGDEFFETPVRDMYTLHGMITAWHNNPSLYRSDEGRSFLITAPDLYKPLDDEKQESEPLRLDRDNKEQFKMKIDHGLSKISDKPLAYICASGGHWSLLVLDPETHKFRYVDSAGGTLNNANLLAVLGELGYSNIEIAPVKQQFDGTSCGLWTIFNASSILSGGIGAELVVFPNQDAGLDDLRLENQRIFHNIVLEKWKVQPPTDPVTHEEEIAAALSVSAAEARTKDDKELEEMLELIAQSEAESAAAPEPAPAPHISGETDLTGDVTTET